MKTSIREGVFETNSSSTHSLVIMEESDFKKWKDGKLFYNEDNYIPQANRKLDKELDALYKDHSEFYTKKEIEDLKKFFSDHDIEIDEEEWEETFQTYEHWRQEDELESSVYKHTTPGGEKIVAVAKYGYC